MNEKVDRDTFVTTLAGSHGERLRRFLASRLRHSKANVPDLVQEVFLRLWRIARPDAIQNPEAYLYYGRESCPAPILIAPVDDARDAELV